MKVAVIGAGFGGLGAALSLAEQGVAVRLYEALSYPGGCASTFRKKGYAFESGATLFSGLGADQLFGRWVKKHQIPVVFDFISPLVEMRVPGFKMAVGQDREAFLAALCALPGAPAARIQAFFAYQKQVSDILWSLFDDPSLLPPLNFSLIWRHLGRSLNYLPLFRVVGRSLWAVLDDFGLADFKPLTQWLSGLCQITVQCAPAEAEALFAMATIDYYWRGTGHVRGGIGNLAVGLTEAIKNLGGTVCMADRVQALRPEGKGWRVISRSGEAVVDQVIANVLPGDLATLLDQKLPQLATQQAAVETGWGAVMLYRAVRAAPGASASAHHLELIQDPTQPCVEGNHVFVSISGEADVGRAPAGQRTVTLSTHVAGRAFWAQNADQQAEQVARIQQKMRGVLAEMAPEWEDVVAEFPGSPRTFARFVRRGQGYVGGIPRRVGWHNYTGMFAKNEILPGMWIVGDSVFPGQSTLAVALGGVKMASDLLSR